MHKILAMKAWVPDSAVGLQLALNLKHNVKAQLLKPILESSDMHLQSPRVSLLGLQLRFLEFAEHDPQSRS